MPEGIEIKSRFSSVNPARIAKLIKRRRDGNTVGLEGILPAIDTNIQNGIIGDSNDIEERRQAFGSNLVSEDYIINLVHYFGHFACESIKDPTIVMSFVCSVLSLGFGIQKNGLKQGWQEGVARFSVIAAAILISSAGNFWPTYQSLITSEDSSRIPKADVVRDGSWLLIEICNVVVGDIVFLKPGDQVPGDGLFIEGCSLLVEGQWEHIQACDGVDEENPYLYFGGTVVNGYAKMVVTAVGKNKKLHTICFKGKLLDDTAKLTALAGKIVQTIAWMSFAILLYDFLAGGYIYDNNVGNVQAAIVRIVATPLIIALTSRHDSLVLAVKIGFAYAMKKMMEIKVLVRDPSMCHSIASITTLCLNKTGTLTEDSMEVANFFQGLKSIDDVPVDSIPSNIFELLCQGIGLNTIQAPCKSSIASTTISAEKAILDWAVIHWDMDIEALKESCTILEVELFTPRNRSSCVLIKKNIDNTFHVHRKGAPDVIIPMCSHYYDNYSGIKKVIDRRIHDSFEQFLNEMAEKGLRCYAFAHKKTSIREYFTSNGQKRLVLLGFVGMKNKRRFGAKRLVQECQRAGINLKLITGDNLSTAKVIATKCGILAEDHNHLETIEGRVFRMLSGKERMDRVDHIRVLARATPDDKLLMVQCLRQKEHVVGYLGQGIGDVMALREANVALSFGTHGAEIAKACMGLFLACKDIHVIVDILKWGRSLYDNIQVYTQFLITSTFVALILELVTMFASTNSDALTQLSKGQSPYPVVPLLWAKLINGTFSALVLIVKPPKEGVMRKPPRSRKHLLITPHIWTEIYLQLLSQLAILLCIHFKASSLFLVNSDVKQAMIFNTYILFQVFAMLDATIFDATFFDNINVIQKNRVSFGIMLLLVFVQVLMLGVLKKCADTATLGWDLWAACVIMAAPYWLVSLLVKKLYPLMNIFKWPFVKLKVN